MRRSAPAGLLGVIAARIRGMYAVATGAGTALPPWDDYWYTRPGWDSAAGMAITPETSMRIAAVFSCVRVRSESLASSPLIIYKRLPGGGKVRAPEHPLYRVLHNSPNQWQTSLEFIEMMQGHLDLRGNAFAHIVPGPSGPIDQLVPLHPDLVQVYRLPNGRLKYQVRSRWSGEVNWYTQDEIFHLRGLSSDGLVGLSPVAAQREEMGIGLGLQDYSSRFLRNDSATSTWIEVPQKFQNDAAREEFKNNWQKSRIGERRHETAVLEAGMKLHQIGLSNKDSQFLEAVQANAERICGIYRVPPHKIGILSRSTNNNIEHQGLEFVTDCMQNIATRWERRINVDLIDPLEPALGGGSEHFAEFRLEGLIRGGMKDRFDAYAVARNWGWMCPDDICEREGMNPLPEGKGGQEYLRPLNMVPAGTIYLPPMATDEPDPEDKPAPSEQKTDPEQTPPSDEPDDEGEDKPNANAPHLLRLFAMEAGRRVVRKEVTALRKSLARDPAAFRNEAAKFYEGHQLLVSQTMCLTPGDAGRYVAHNLRLLSAADPDEISSALDWIEDTAPAALAEMALGTRSKQETAAV